MTRCTNVACPAPAVRWDRAAAVWVHRTTGERSCALGAGRLMPPLTQRRSRRPDQLFWPCPACGTWVPVRPVQDGAGGLYARCCGPARYRHAPTTWVSAEGLEAPPEPVDTPPVPEQRNGFHEALPAGGEATWEYGIEYHYSPDRWHVLPNLATADRASAERELARRRRGFGEGGTRAYRLLRRRAAGPWAQVPG